MQKLQGFNGSCLEMVTVKFLQADNNEDDAESSENNTEVIAVPLLFPLKNRITKKGQT